MTPLPLNRQCLAAGAYCALARRQSNRAGVQPSASHAWILGFAGLGQLLVIVCAVHVYASSSLSSDIASI